VNGIKVVPVDSLNLLTPIALAHWIMGDGEARDYGLILYTDSFTIQDVVHLMNVLMIKYELECTLRVKSAPRGPVSIEFILDLIPCHD
jgi:LAGLIDADG DNA endonuclease family